MDLHADLSQRTVLQIHSLDWTTSPVLGVERRLLDRAGGEVALATSIVRYASGSHFARHSHGGGEEILVLKGTYLRNPMGSSYAPFSERLAIDTHRAARLPGLVTGLEVMPLPAFGSEHVALAHWAPGSVHSPWSDLGCTI